jgi:hypothetical protein
MNVSSSAAEYVSDIEKELPSIDPTDPDLIILADPDPIILALVIKIARSRKKKPVEDALSLKKYLMAKLNPGAKNLVVVFSLKK